MQQQLDLNMTDWDAIEQFIYAGRAMFTLRSRKTDRDFTYRVRKAEDKLTGKPRYFVDIETGYMRWQYLGTFIPERLPLISLTVTTSFKSLIWFLRALHGRQADLLDQIEFKHLGRCGRCGRTLTDSVSIDRGIGPECITKLGE